MTKRSPTDPVTLRHPELPGVEIVKTYRRLAHFARSGWVEAKSPKAPADDETQTQPIPTGDNPEEGSNDRNRT